MSPEVVRMIARIERIDATFLDTGARIIARYVLLREDRAAFVQAVRVLSERRDNATD